MENNEIPPYDIPFNNDDNGETNLNPTDSENNSTDDQILNFDDIEENENINTQEQDSEISDDAPSPEEINNTQAPNKKGSLAALFIIVFILAIILLGALAYIYADALNLPFLSKKSPDTVETMNLSNDMSGNLDSLQEEDASLDNSEVQGEESEDTGIEITRSERSLDKNQQNSPSLPENRERPRRMNNDENFPPLPGTNNQNMMNDQMARIRYYSGPVGRLDPFNPKSSSGADLFEIIVPPVDPTPDTETQALMSLRISGIMYTPEAPSAIINIKGQDQLVRKGDKFDGFSVEKITKDKVTVKAGVNVYTASVGEILNIEQVGINSIPNLGKKFAGPYSKGKDKIIEINMID